MFKKWKNRIIELKKIAIPRRLSRFSFKQGKMSIHVFCDACKTSYATCIFLRNEFQDQVTCQLLQARSRVAPLKNITIVRLELLACCIGARLAGTVKKDLKLEDVDVFYWSDSMDALHWIKKEGPWKTFVENRVKEIRKLSELYKLKKFSKAARTILTRSVSSINTLDQVQEPVEGGQLLFRNKLDALTNWPPIHWRGTAALPLQWQPYRPIRSFCKPKLSAGTGFSTESSTFSSYYWSSEGSSECQIKVFF
ncbi:reverse transcriptase [Caerostris extrusa]|uniref:Reverse transcriptase n=1 Tax=Caerostris extrusa TaxID=172846 RepID=A0AAV4NAD9_CAEEX|nr:reverse transcriptase [Caerostris extrusa]